jgi:F-type H+-transporting ATPase subunit gamma
MLMSSLPILRRRIRSVGNTRQITKAMQLVAASKLHQAEEAAKGPAAYTSAIQALAAEIAGWPEAALHPLLAERPTEKVLLIIITSDRGLAGAYNSNLLREMGRQISGESEYFAICVGKRGASAVARASDVTEIAAYDLESDEADIELAKPIAREAADGFTSGEFDQIKLVSTRFHSTIQQEVSVQQLLPLTGASESAGTSLTEPGLSTLINQTICRYLEAMVMQSLAEASASEQAARMLAMMNATDNAGDLIEDLTLAYNQERQAAITQELAEISAGVEALQGGSA